MGYSFSIIIEPTSDSKNPPVVLRFGTTDKITQNEFLRRVRAVVLAWLRLPINTEIAEYMGSSFDYNDLIVYYKHIPADMWTRYGLVPLWDEDIQVSVQSHTELLPTIEPVDDIIEQIKEYILNVWKMSGSKKWPFKTMSPNAQQLRDIAMLCSCGDVEEIYRACETVLGT